MFSGQCSEIRVDQGLWRTSGALFEKMDPNDGGQNDTTELVNESDAGIWYDLTSAPCFRESLLYAVGGGGAIGALNMLRNRT